MRHFVTVKFECHWDKNRKQGPPGKRHGESQLLNRSYSTLTNIAEVMVSSSSYTIFFAAIEDSMARKLIV
jgi:hypothetical protein